MVQQEGRHQGELGKVVDTEGEQADESCCEYEGECQNGYYQYDKPVNTFFDSHNLPRFMIYKVKDLSNFVVKVSFKPSEPPNRPINGDGHCAIVVD